MLSPKNQARLDEYARALKAGEIRSGRPTRKRRRDPAAEQELERARLETKRLYDSKHGREPADELIDALLMDVD